MLRVTLSNTQAKRTLKPLYAFTQSTPKSVFLDPAWNQAVPIYAGMVLTKTVGENVTLLGNGTTAPQQPYGLAAFMEGVPGIESEITNQGGVNAAACWVLGPDAEFEVMSPAFDTTATWTDPGTGAPVLVYGQTAGATRGKLVPAGTAGASVKPVARLLKVNSATKITIGGLDPNWAIASA